jgi:hypothetical protein
MAFIFIVAFIAGLFMFLLAKGDTKRIGEMLLFACILALLFAVTPSTVTKFFH